MALLTKIPPSVMLEEHLGKLHKTRSSRGLFAEPKPESHFGTDTEQKVTASGMSPTVYKPQVWDLQIVWQQPQLQDLHISELSWP